MGDLPGCLSCFWDEALASIAMVRPARKRSGLHEMDFISVCPFEAASYRRGDHDRAAVEVLPLQTDANEAPRVKDYWRLCATLARKG